MVSLTNINLQSMLMLNVLLQSIESTEISVKDEVR